MKKKIMIITLLFFLTLFISSISEADFDLECVTEGVQVVNIGDYADFEIYLTNTNSEPELFWLGYFFPYETFPDDWELEIWLDDENYSDSTSVELPAGEEQAIIFRVYVESNALGVVAFAVHPVDDPMDEDFVILSVATPDISIQNDGFTQIPQQTKLHPNYPNPFNPITILSYQLPEKTIASLKIYNLEGQLIKTLVEEEQSPGFHKVIWNAHQVPSGTYISVLSTDSFSCNQKLILLQ